MCGKLPPRSLTLIGRDVGWSTFFHKGDYLCSSVKPDLDRAGESRRRRKVQYSELGRSGTTDRESRERDSELQHLVARKATELGILTDSSSASLNIQPSLAMQPEVFSAALDRIAEAVDQAIVELGR